MATVVTSGQDFEVRNVTLNSTTDTAVDFNNKVNSITLRARTSIDVQIRRNKDGADYFTIPSGSSLTLDVASSDNSEGGYISCWARSASGTPVLEAIGAF